MRCAPRASHGSNHLGLCGLQADQAEQLLAAERAQSVAAWARAEEDAAADLAAQQGQYQQKLDAVISVAFLGGVRSMDAPPSFCAPAATLAELLEWH